VEQFIEEALWIVVAVVTILVVAVFARDYWETKRKKDKA
jgi:hypothetical protein